MTTPVKRTQQKTNWEKILSFMFGFIFVVVILTISIKFPYPTDFQLYTFRVVLALASAGICAMIPGFISIQGKVLKNVIRANGAIGGFALVYLLNPPNLVSIPSKSLSPSAGLAYGYYSNFLVPLNNALNTARTLQIDDSSCVNNFDTTSIEIIVPAEVKYLSVQNITFLKNKFLSEVNIQGDHRKFSLYKFRKRRAIYSNSLHFLDVPTTVNVIKQYLHYRTGDHTLDWNDPQVIDITENELNKFIKTLELLLSSNELDIKIKVRKMTNEEILNLLNK